MSTVAEAIEVATTRHARVPECLARIVHADLLIRSTGNASAGEQELNRASALMRETGALIFQRMFEDIGSKMPNPLPGSVRLG